MVVRNTLSARRVTEAALARARVGGAGRVGAYSNAESCSSLILQVNVNIG